MTRWKWANKQEGIKSSVKWKVITCQNVYRPNSKFPYNVTLVYFQFIIVLTGKDGIINRKVNCPYPHLLRGRWSLLGWTDGPFPGSSGCLDSSPTPTQGAHTAPYRANQLCLVVKVYKKNFWNTMVTKEKVVTQINRIFLWKVAKINAVIRESEYVLKRKTR